ncbi:MAG: hypothetical protein ACO1SV_07825 [Fimbriimonas sp.]
MPPSAPTPRTRRSAQVIQWTAYALAGVLLGLAWLPFAKWIGYPIENPARDVLWVGFAGLVFALAFRGLTYGRGSEPSQWLAAAFPLIACTGRSFANLITGAPYEFAATAGEDWFWSFVYAYTCVSVAVIPLAAVHLTALRWLHQRLVHWEARANRRGVRRAGYAVACAILMLATEGPHLMSGEPVSAHDLARRFGFSLPANSELIRHSKRNEWGFESFWIASTHRISWPLVEGSKPVTEPLPNAYLVTRAIEEAGARFKKDEVEVRQAKWTAEGRRVRANLVRIGHRDYLEIAWW